MTCPWPDDFSKILEYQWNDVLIPYWKEKAAFAASHGVHKIALELHPGFCVYNTRTLLRLREAVGPEIGANFDPSHLIWQGMDPCAAIRELGNLPSGLPPGQPEKVFTTGTPSSSARRMALVRSSSKALAIALSGWSRIV